MEVEEPKKVDTKRYKLFAEISNAFSLKILLDWINNTNTDGNLIFDQKGITFFRSHADKTITNTVTLKSHKLKFYHYNTEEEEIIFGFTINELKSITNNIGKKDYLALKINSDDKSLYVKIISGDVTNNNEHWQKVRFQKLKDLRLRMIDFTRPIEDPVCNIVMATFTKSCGNLHKLGRNGTFTFEIYPKGIKITGSSPGNLTDLVFPFGDCPEDQKSKKYEIEHSTLKSFSKITGLSSGQDTFQVYTENGKPLRFIFDIGNYGSLVVDINSS